VPPTPTNSPVPPPTKTPTPVPPTPTDTPQSQSVDMRGIAVLLTTTPAGATSPLPKMQERPLAT
jgi:hypothetical protein